MALALALASASASACHPPQDRALTPNISVESAVGQQGTSDVGIKFKWDY
ncbi:MAG: hypothetical protein WCF16_00855 [Alphaproteobacteria bacterium]